MIDAPCSSQAARANDGRPKQPQIDTFWHAPRPRLSPGVSRACREFFEGTRTKRCPQPALCGGYITEHYGRPDAGHHAIQIEINRAIYMDERSYQRHAGLDRHLSETMLALVAHLAATPGLTAQLTGNRSQENQQQSEWPIELEQDMSDLSALLAFAHRLPMPPHQKPCRFFAPRRKLTTSWVTTDLTP